MEKDWKYIHHWLGLNAPKILASLNPPATDKQLAALQSRFKVPLPDDFIALYRTHNGFDYHAVHGLFWGINFASIDEILQEHALEIDLQRDCASECLAFAQPSISSTQLFNSNRIAFGNGGRSTLFVDLEPTIKGAIGQVIFRDLECSIALKLANSITDMVAQFSLDLLVGNYRLCEFAAKEGDEWLMPSKELDVGNWMFSDRWSYVKEALDNRTR